MLLRLHHRPSPAELEALLGLGAELGYRGEFLDAGQTLLELRRVTGAGDPADRSRFEEVTCVAKVLEHGDAPELAQRTDERPDTVVRVGEAVIGGDSAALLAGPCAVEDEERLIEIARAVKDAGATVLRAGAYKPRTSPYGFQGLGEEGLRRLATAKAETGLAVTTEVLDPRDVERVGEVADLFQIGSRSMANAALLREVGRTRTPVLLKRGMAASAREFLLAAEYVLAGGNSNVVLCERGLRGFDTVTRNVLDVGTVAWLKRATHLPVIVDPSHAAGTAALVRPLARAGIAAGADGLLVEVHSNPAEVHSDGAQAISLADFAALAAETRNLLALLDRTLSGPTPKPASPLETSFS
jgi:3-deoxy-7-phosphoheptulonate synthase